MTYYIARTLDSGFDEAVARAKAGLAAEGFGVLVDIDIAATLKAKLGADHPAYRILGACNPALAHEALMLEDKVGTMLPCNVVVRDAGGGRTEIAAIDPVASMQAIDNPALKDKAALVRAMLARAIAAA